MMDYGVDSIGFLLAPPVVLLLLLLVALRCEYSVCVMGVVCIFVKTNCSYCVYIKEMLNAHVSRINADLLLAITAARGKKNIEKETNQDFTTTTTHPTPSLLQLHTYDCSDGARAAQCIKYTSGTSTVPHVFFNERYIGDADTLLKMDQEDQPKLLSMLRELAEQENTNFPPTPEAAMIKVTENEAFASQPTLEQLLGLHAFGFRSVINLLDPTEHAFVKREVEILKEAGVVYHHVPFVGKFPHMKKTQVVDHVLALIKSCPSPVLVHCDNGRR